MLPAPCPDAGVGAVIQFASEDAFQLHSGCVLTATVVLAPPASIDAAGAVSVTTHFAGDGPVEVATVEPQPVDAPATHHATSEPRKFVRRGCEARSSCGQNDGTTRECICELPKVFKRGAPQIIGAGLIHKTSRANLCPSGRTSSATADQGPPVLNSWNCPGRRAYGKPSSLRATKQGGGPEMSASLRRVWQKQENCAAGVPPIVVRTRAQTTIGAPSEDREASHREWLTWRAHKRAALQLIAVITHARGRGS